MDGGAVWREVVHDDVVHDDVGVTTVPRWQVGEAPRLMPTVVGKPMAGGMDGTRCGGHVVVAQVSVGGAIGDEGRREQDAGGKFDFEQRLKPRSLSVRGLYGVGAVFDSLDKRKWHDPQTRKMLAAL